MHANERSVRVVQKDEVNVKVRKEVMSARGESEQLASQIRVELREANEKVSQLTQQVCARACARN